MLQYLPTVLSGATVFSSGYQFHLDRHHHHRNLVLDKEFFDADFTRSRNQHKEGLFNSKQTYLISIYADIESYYQELNENLLNSTLDAERDMVDQRNQQYQTTLISATIMLGATIGVLFQAPLPVDCDEIVVIVYSTSIAASLLSLFVSVGLCVKVVYLVSRYMYKSSDRNLLYVKNAREETKKIMVGIRAGFPPPEVVNSIIKDIKEKKPYMRRAFSTANEEKLNEIWDKHEVAANHYFEVRNRINDEYFNGTPNKENLKRFSEFWATHCKLNGRIATFCFYLGTTCMLISTATFMYSAFDISFSSRAASVISAAIIGSSLVICFVVVIYLKYFDPAVLQLRQN